MSTHAGDEPRSRPRIGPHRHLGGFGLVLVMAAGSIVMWLVSPIAWLWVASRMTSSSQPSLGPYLLVIVGMVVTAVVIGKFLGIVNRAHMRVTGRLTDKREQAAWMKSMRGERRGVHNDRGVLEQVMAISVGLALVLFGIWFFAFAGSSLPS
jgi:MFS family permease